MEHVISGLLISSTTLTNVSKNFVRADRKREVSNCNPISIGADCLITRIVLGCHRIKLKLKFTKLGPFSMGAQM